jgi:hypothetical protein
MFDRTAKGWEQVQVLKGSDTTPGDQLGADAKLSGNELIVGATKKSGKGRAYIFTKTAAG